MAALPDSVSVMRRIVAAIGRSLISMGVLLLLFVAYQLWGTGIAYSKAQDQAKQEFQTRLGVTGQSSGGSVEDEFSPENLGANIPPDLSLTTPPSTVTSSTISSIAPDNSTTTIPARSSTVPLVTSATAPPVTVTTLPKVRAGRSKMRRPPSGKVLGRLVIPRIKKDLVFVEGAGVEDLKSGPGHYAKTPLPGEAGNVGIACHRTTYGAPCFNLHLMQPGDPIFFQTDYGKFRYEVVSHSIVSPKDKKVLAPTPGESVLTITTCNPQYSAAQRYVIRARLVGTAVDTDLFFEPEPEVTIPPTTEAPTTVAARDAVSSDPSEDPTVEDTTLAAVSDTTDTTIPGSVVETESLQAERSGKGRVITFGWFSGRQSFWVSTLLWMLVCSAIWIGAWLLARRRRLIGQAVIYTVGFAMVFLPALYFCFENLAHLLPENV